MVATPPVITIDGPSGAGKGTLSQWLAQQLNWHFLDSGALYRLVALSGQQLSVPLADIATYAQLALQLDVQFVTRPDTEVETYLAGNEVSVAIRNEDCARAASQLAASPAVREALLDRQRAFRQAPGLVADGRDMGTVVFPDAKLKFFLTASPEERAKRRYKQLNQKGISANLAGLLRDIQARDLRDQQRAVAPLKPAQDALLVDTTSLGVEAMYRLVAEHVRASGLL